MIENVKQLSQVRQDVLTELNRYDCRILVCSGTGCIATGSDKIHKLFQGLVSDTPGVLLEFAPHDEAEHEKLVGVKKTG